MRLSIEEKELLDNSLIEIIEASYAMSTGAIWVYLENFFPELEKRKEAFLYVLEQLLRQGKVKIGKEYGLVDSSIEEIIRDFCNSWPSEKEFDEDHFSTVKPYRVPGEEWWCSHYWTPGDLVWIDQDDGHELWATEAEWRRSSFKHIEITELGKFPEANIGCGLRYTYKNPETGISIMLRSKSESDIRTDIRWVIEINKDPRFAKEGRLVKAEMKFK